MKKAYRILFLLVLLVFATYYFYVVKPVKINDPAYLDLCITHDGKYCEFITRESAKYIVRDDWKKENDTLTVSLYTTSVSNIFNADKRITRKFNIAHKVQYISYCDVVLPISQLNPCNQ